MKEKDYTQIEDVDVDGIDMGDYPDFCDAFICSAYWKDGTPLTEEEVDELNMNHREIVDEYVAERLF